MMMTTKQKINILRGALLTVASTTVALVATIWYQRTHTVPKGTEPVEPFDLDKYVGKWYEVARLPHKHETNLTNVTAEYELRENGMIGVRNTGYNPVRGKWEQAEGKAQFVGNPSRGALEVSFFGPFYFGYNVIALEGDYEYALVVASTTELAWILSRTPEIPSEVRSRLETIALKSGIEVDDFIWVEHNEQDFL